MVMQERLQKVLAQAGLGSRRQIEEWIRAGRIRVDGQPAELGQKVSGRERITVDGRQVGVRAAHKSPPEVLAYHKPVGEVVTPISGIGAGGSGESTTMENSRDKSSR